jgi:tight adherence protein B
MAGCGLFFVVWTLFSPRPPVDDTQGLGRLERYIAQQSAPPEADRRTSLERVIGYFHDAMTTIEDHQHSEERLVHRHRLAEQLQKADVAWRPIEWQAMLLGVGIVLFTMLTLHFNVIAGAVAGVLIPVFGGRFLLTYLQRRRVTRFDSQLGDVLLVLANALKAGYSFPQALMTVANSAPSPIASEFGRTSREMQLGLPADDALRRIVERNASEDLDLMITAIQIQRVVGGNLTEILENIAHTIRDRVRIQGEIRTLTAQARVSGWIISLLPIGLAVVLTVVAPDYFTPMFKQTGGQILLGVALFSMGCGIMIIRKIVAIRI